MTHLTTLGYQSHCHWKYMHLVIPHIRSNYSNLTEFVENLPENKFQSRNGERSINRQLYIFIFSWTEQSKRPKTIQCYLQIDTSTTTPPSLPLSHPSFIAIPNLPTKSSRSVLYLNSCLKLLSRRIFFVSKAGELQYGNAGWAEPKR